MSTATDKAALAMGTTAVADVTGVRGVLYRAAASATSQGITLPLNATTGKAHIAGKWVAILSESVSVQVAFGSGAAAPTLVFGQAVTAGTGSAAAGVTVPAGVPYQCVVPLDAKFLSVISGASPSGNVEVYVFEGLSGGL
jgi:hypothetical protein